MENQSDGINESGAFVDGWRGSDEYRKKQLALWKYVLDQGADAFEKAEKLGAEIEEAPLPSPEEMKAIYDNFSDEDMEKFLSIRKLDGSEWDEHRRPTIKEYEEATGRRLRRRRKE